MNCRVCGGEVKQFLDLGKQPIANGFLTKRQFSKEFFYNLKVGVCAECAMVQLIELVPPGNLFGKNYPFKTSSSYQMVKHQKQLADFIKKHALEYSGLIVEIGYNDGSFLKNFKDYRYIGVDPSSLPKENSHIIREFFSPNVGNFIVESVGQAQVIVSLNTLCHIPNLNELFEAVNILLEPGGVLIFEDPYWDSIKKDTAFDQIYDEHVYYFSVTSVEKVAEQHGLKLVAATWQPVHGGSMRYFVAKATTRTFILKPPEVPEAWTLIEKATSLSDETFNGFQDAIDRKRRALQGVLATTEGKRTVGYGATSKSTTLLNYCNIGRDQLEYITDTTLAKQGKYSPGQHIPIVSPDEFHKNPPDYTLLLAWNHQAEIMEKEKKFKGGWIHYQRGGWQV